MRNGVMLRVFQNEKGEIRMSATIARFVVDCRGPPVGKGLVTGKVSAGRNNCLFGLPPVPPHTSVTE